MTVPPDLLADTLLYSSFQNLSVNYVLLYALSVRVSVRVRVMVRVRVRVRVCMQDTFARTTHSA